MTISNTKLNEAVKKILAGDAARDFGVPPRVGRYATIPVHTSEKAPQGRAIFIDPGVPKPLKPRDPVRTSGYSLIPPGPLGEVARVLDIGAKKYEPRGWEKGLPWSDVFDRIGKHLGRWQRGEKYDLEDGQHNLASVAWAALVLMEFENTHPELDDIHAKGS